MIQTYKFYEKGAIPGIPGEFHAGLVVDINTDTNEIVEARLMTDDEKAIETEGEDDEGTPDLPDDIVPPPPPEARSPFFFGSSPELNPTPATDEGA